MFLINEVKQLEQGYKKAKSELSNITHINGYPNYPKAISEFMGSLYSPPWGISSYEPSKTKAIIESIEFASENDIRNVLMHASRSERFGDGIWCSILEGEFFPKVIARAYELAKT